MIESSYWKVFTYLFNCIRDITMSDTNQESFKEMEERIENKLNQLNNKNEKSKSEDTTIKSIPAVISVL